MCSRGTRWPTRLPLPVPVPGAPVELTVYLIERAGGLALDLRYDSDLYDGDRVGALGGDLVALLADLVAHPDRPVGQAPTRFRTDGVTTHPPAAGQRRASALTGRLCRTGSVGISRK